MSIKQRITVGFTILVATLLLLFSVFIYQTYESYRRSQMRTRLQRRALSAQLYLQNKPEFLRSSYLTLPEQYESLFNAVNQRIYQSSGLPDYIVMPTLLQQARSREVYFTYSNSRWKYEKEGVALSFDNSGNRYVAVVTAYDLAGRQTSQNLRFILLAGNILSLLVIALVGFLFARRAMRPFDALISQLNSATVNDFSFRLGYAGRTDEAGYLATSFDKLLGQLSQLAASQENFVAYASHELRTPLTVVKGLLETSLAYDQTLPDARQSTEKALLRLEGAIDLANALLRLAEVDGLRASRLQEDVNVVDTLFDTVAYINEKYPHRLINVQLTDEFTEQSSAIRVVGNATLLRTALINMLDNACKYSGSQPVEVQVDYQPEWVLMHIIDRGIGIPPTQLSDVFLPMMRAENVGSVGGFGLGLTLAKRIIDMHQGELSVEPGKGEGTEVSIRLPALPLA